MAIFDRAFTVWSIGIFGWISYAIIRSGTYDYGIGASDTRSKPGTRGGLKSDSRACQWYDAEHRPTTQIDISTICTQEFIGV